MQSYDTAKNVSLKAFTGGYIDNLQDFLLPEGNSPYLRNMRIDGYGVTNRKVAVATSTTFSMAYGMGTVYDFGNYTTNGYSSQLLAVSYNDGANKVRLTDLTTTKDVTVGSMGPTYFVGGNKSAYLMDGVNPLGKIHDVSGTLSYLDVSTTNNYLARYFVGIQPPTNMSFGVIASNKGGLLGFGPGGNLTNMPQNQPIRFVGDLPTSVAPTGITFNTIYYASPDTFTDTRFLVSTDAFGGGTVLYTNTGTQPFHVEYFRGDELRCYSDDGGKACFVLSDNDKLTISPPHQLPDNTKVRIVSDIPSAVAPTNFSFNTDYYVRPSNRPYFFELSATSGGTSIAFWDGGVPSFHLMLSPIPKYGDVFDNRLWLLDENLQNMVVHSKPNDFDNLTNGGQYWFNEPITGIKSTAQALFFFSTRKIYVIYYGDVIQNTDGSQSYNVRTLSSIEGTENHKSIVSTGDTLYYVTPTNRICRIIRGQSINGFDVEQLSSRPYKGIPKVLNEMLSVQSGYYDVKNNRIKWFFSGTTHTYKNALTCIVYDITHDAFLLDDNICNNDADLTVVYPYDCCYADIKSVSNGGGGFLLGYKPSTTASFTLYKDEYDYSVAIPNEYRTPRYTFGMPNFKKEFWESRLTAGLTASCHLYEQIYVSDVLVSSTNLSGADYDFSVGQLEQLSQGLFPIGGEIDSWNTRYIAHVNTTGNLKAKGQTIQFRYTHNEAGTYFRLEGLDVRLATLPPDQLNYNSLL